MGDDDQYSKNNSKTKFDKIVDIVLGLGFLGLVEYCFFSQKFGFLLGFVFLILGFERFIKPALDVILKDKRGENNV